MLFLEITLTSERMTKKAAQIRDFHSLELNVQNSHSAPPLSIVGAEASQKNVSTSRTIMSTS